MSAVDVVAYGERLRCRLAVDVAALGERQIDLGRDVVDGVAVSG